MGDFNINLLLHDTSRSVQDYINTLSSNSFFNLLTNPLELLLIVPRSLITFLLMIF